MNNKLLIFFAEIVFKHFQKTHFQKESPYFHASFTNRKNAKQRFLQLITEDMGFEPTHAFTRLLRFQHSLLSLLSNLPFLNMEPVGVEPTSKHLPTHLSTTIGYVLF